MSTWAVKDPDVVFWLAFIFLFCHKCLAVILHHHKISRRTRMNKTELVNNVAESAGITKVEAEKVVKSVLESIAKALANNDSVTLIGFGSFSVSTRAARTGRNPQTGKEIQIAEKKVVKFRPGKKLTDSICIKEKAGSGCKTPKAKKKK
jgi:DNA-binding protein HU-beta